MLVNVYLRTDHTGPQHSGQATKKLFSYMKDDELELENVIFYVCWI